MDSERSIPRKPLPPDDPKPQSEEMQALREQVRHLRFELDGVIANLLNGCHPTVHSDRGCHYRWPGWIERMKEAGLVRSMSKKGCSPDNVALACEVFFAD